MRTSYQKWSARVAWILAAAVVLIASIGVVQLTSIGMAFWLNHPAAAFAQPIWLPLGVVGAAGLVAVVLLWLAATKRAKAAMQKRLERTEAYNTAQNQFLAAVSHELRTPLTVVLGIASDVGDQWDDLPVAERTAVLSMMTEQAHEAANIVEDLLVVARSETDVLEISCRPTTFDSHIQYAIESVPAEERHRITLVGDTHLRGVVDPTRLRQILRNLIENAVRHGGPNIQIRSWTDRDLVHVSVEDDGPPIADEKLGVIFQPFESLEAAPANSPSAVGIGLFVSRQLARAMSGELACVQAFRRTYFVLSVPAAEKSQVDEPEHLSVVSA